MRQLEELLKLQELDLAVEHRGAGQREEQRAMLLHYIDADLLARYDKLRRAGLGRALAQIQDGACACCLAIIAPSELEEVYKDERPQTCSNCGRILYTLS